MTPHPEDQPLATERAQTTAQHGEHELTDWTCRCGQAYPAGRLLCELCGCTYWGSKLAAPVSKEPPADRPGREAESFIECAGEGDVDEVVYADEHRRIVAALEQENARLKAAAEKAFEFVAAADFATAHWQHQADALYLELEAALTSAPPEPSGDHHTKFRGTSENIIILPASPDPEGREG